MLGERLRTFRQRKRLTQGELAKVFRITADELLGNEFAKT